MPTFCRHNRLIQNCSICAREQNIQARPLVSSSAPKSTLPHERPAGTPKPAQPRAPRAGRTSQQPGRQRAGGLRVRRMERGAEDGFRSGLVPGLKSSEDAERLAQELTFATQRLFAIEAGATAPWAELADTAGDIEERTWLAFLIAYIGPQDAPDPFAAIESARTGWASAENPRWEEVHAGPRGAFELARADATVDAYRAWAARAGSQAAAFSGEQGWTAQRRFERLFERLALPGLTRDVRFELLTSLGGAGVYALRAGSLRLSGENEATWAAKRALGIADPMLLERRALELAEACGVPLDALDLALHNWGSGVRVGGGFDVDTELDADLLEQVAGALGVEALPA